MSAPMSRSAGRIRVVIVDDSALIRQLMTQIVNAQTDMEVAGVAPDALVARELIKQVDPDVVTLDVEMPRMNGLDFLEKIMRLRPTPVVMISTLTENGSETALRALELGAVDFVPKPKLNVMRGMDAIAEEIVEKIRAAAMSRIHRMPHPRGATRPPVEVGGFAATGKLIVVGASTGGTEALKDFLTPLPAECPAILIAQHMPEGFTRSFAQRLDGLCRMQVKEAEDGEPVQPGQAYIAPGHSHLLLKKNATGYHLELSRSEPVNRHRPSVDVLFRSAAAAAGRNAIGVILTGMGKDGAAGLLDMKRAGAYTYAQDEASCVVFGMPKAAIGLGAADRVVPLQEMAACVVAAIAGKRDSSEDGR